MPKKLKQLACAYCGAEPAGSVDHVPPRALFIAPLPSNLTSVPSCVACNGAAARDQDFFLATLMLSDAGATPHGTTLWEHRIRTSCLRTPGFRREIAGRLSLKNVMSPAGLFLRQSYVFELNSKRLERFVSHQARGLYWLEFGERLLPETRVEALWLDTQEKGRSLEPILATLGWGKHQRPDVFEYRGGRTAEDPQASLWCIRFLGKAVFSVSTAGPSVLHTAGERLLTPTG